MPDIVQTAAQLQAEFADNTTGAITAQDGRNLVVSAFGGSGTAGPNVDFDNVDTANSGNFYDVGSKFFNLTTMRCWLCLDGSPGHAKWQALMYDSQPAGGDLSGYYPNPIFINDMITPGTYGDATHSAEITFNSVGKITAVAQVAISGGGGGGVSSVTGGTGITVSPTTGAPVVSLTCPISTSCIPSLPASQITSGTFDVTLIPYLSATYITSGVFNLTLIPNLPASQITSGSLGWDQAPPDAAICKKDTVTLTTNDSYQTIYTLSDVKGLHFSMGIQGTGGGEVKWRLTGNTSWANGTGYLTTTLSPEVLGFWDHNWPDPSSPTGPLLFLRVECMNGQVGSPQTATVICSRVNCGADIP